MYKGDKFWLGVILGLVFPLIAYISVTLLKFDVHILGKENILYIASALLNLIMMRFLYFQGRANTATGVIFSTFICALFFIILIR
jgi:hypothetical protein